MDFLNGNIKPMYFKYLSAAFGSAMISSVYSIVDTAMVGQYHGPQGTAALAVVAPVWNIIYSLGLLVGIGGSVIFSTRRGSGKSDGSEHQYFTAAVIGAVILSMLAWVGIICFERPILTFFGADEALLALAQSYMRPIQYVFPLFLFNQLLAAFLRNDNAPGLATLGVLSGGIFNIFGDYFFVFPCDMGIYGAGLATAIGAGISFLVILTHFFSRKNTLRLIKPETLLRRLQEIAVTGFSTFFIDVAMGILTVLFNRQIMQYLGASALAIYGPIIQVSTFVQCCAYSVGQASQPIISTNFGAGKGERIKETLRLALWTTGFFGVFWTVLSMAFPNAYIRIFMTPTPEILDMAPAHCPHLCVVVSAPAVQYLFHLLFSGDPEAQGSLCRFGGAGACDQRYSDPGPPGAGPRRRHLVRHAGHGAAGHGLRGFDHAGLHKGAAPGAGLYGCGLLQCGGKSDIMLHYTIKKGVGNLPWTVTVGCYMSCSLP